MKTQIITNLFIIIPEGHLIQLTDEETLKFGIIYSAKCKVSCATFLLSLFQFTHR